MSHAPSAASLHAHNSLQHHYSSFFGALLSKVLNFQCLVYVVFPFIVRWLPWWVPKTGNVFDWLIDQLDCLSSKCIPNLKHLQNAHSDWAVHKTAQMEVSCLQLLLQPLFRTIYLLQDNRTFIGSSLNMATSEKSSLVGVALAAWDDIWPAKALRKAKGVQSQMSSIAFVYSRLRSGSVKTTYNTGTKPTWCKQAILIAVVHARRAHGAAPPVLHLVVPQPA